MPITTWTQAQSILSLSTAQQTLTEALIPLVESDYLAIRNKPWDTGETITVDDAATADGIFTITISVTGSDLNYTVEVNSGDGVEVVAQKIYRELTHFYYGLISVSGAVVTVKGKGFVLSFEDTDGTGVDVTLSGMKDIYPDGATHTALKMIDFRLNTDNQGLASESLGDYSISYDSDRVADYPRAIVGGIKRFVSWA